MLTVKRMSFDWRRNKNVKSLMDAHFSSTVNLPQYSDSASSEKRTPKDSNVAPTVYLLLLYILAKLPTVDIIMHLLDLQIQLTCTNRTHRMHHGSSSTTCK